MDLLAVGLGDEHLVGPWVEGDGSDFARPRRRSLKWMTFLCVENPTVQLGGNAGPVDRGGLVRK